MDRIMADGRSWATILKPLLESPAMRNLARDMQPTLTSYILALIKHPDIANACPERAARHYGLPVAWTREYLRREIERRRRSETDNGKHDRKGVVQEKRVSVSVDLGG